MAFLPNVTDCLAETQMTLDMHYKRAMKRNNRYICMRDHAREEARKKAKEVEQVIHDDNPVTLPMETPDGEFYESDEEMGNEIEQELSNTKNKQPRTELQKKEMKQRAQERQRRKEAEETLSNLKSMVGAEEEVVPENAEWLHMYKTDYSTGNMEKKHAVSVYLIVYPDLLLLLSYICEYTINAG